MTPAESRVLACTHAFAAAGSGQAKPSAFTVPFPPALNTYYRHVGPRVLISAKGRAYRADVLAAPEVWTARRWPAQSRLGVRLTACPPDRRRRDLDGLFKALLDALTHAGIWADDSQIDRLTIMRGPVVKGGRVTVEIEAMK